MDSLLVCPWARGDSTTDVSSVIGNANIVANVVNWQADACALSSDGYGRMYESGICYIVHRCILVEPRRPINVLRRWAIVKAVDYGIGDGRVRDKVAALVGLKSVSKESQHEHT